MTPSKGGKDRRARTATTIGIGGAVMGVVAMLPRDDPDLPKSAARSTPPAQPRAKVRATPPLPDFQPAAKQAKAGITRRDGRSTPARRLPREHWAILDICDDNQAQADCAAAANVDEVAAVISGPLRAEEELPDPAVAAKCLMEALPSPELVDTQVRTDGGPFAGPIQIAEAGKPGMPETPGSTYLQPAKEDTLAGQPAWDIPAADAQRASATALAVTPGLTSAGGDTVPGTIVTASADNTVMPAQGSGEPEQVEKPSASSISENPSTRTDEQAPASDRIAKTAAQFEPARLVLAAAIPRHSALPVPAFGAGLPAPSAPTARASTIPVQHVAPGYSATMTSPSLAATKLPSPAFGQKAGNNGIADVAAANLARGTMPVASGVSSATFAPDDELILEVSTGQGQSSDTLTAYGNRAGVYLPLGELSRLLDLAITISDEGQYASGWVLDERHAIAINLREGTLRLNGQDIALAPRDAAAFEGEMYIKADRFADLMPLTLKVDLRSQTVAIRTLVPFPFEQRTDREAARARLANRSEGDERHFPREETLWRALTFPLADVEVRAVADTPRGPRMEGDVRLASDFALMTGRVFASISSREGLTAARVQLGRRDPDAGLLGPLKATEFQLGDVATGGLPIGLRGVAGRGAMLTNAPVSRLSIFDKIDLRGDLPDGYEAELYRNNTLVGSTRSAVNGQYEFLQVPLSFGLNVFRTVLYGPQGQRHEDVRRISVGDGSLARNELVYSIGFAQKDVSLFSIHGDNFSPAQDYGAWRGTAELQYGIATALTAKVGAAIYQSDANNHWLMTAGLRSSIAGLATKIDVGVQGGSGTGVSAALGGRTAGIDWTATHAEYMGTFSDEVRAFNSDPLVRATEIELSGAIHLGTAARPAVVPVASRFRRIAYADGRVQTDASLRGSMLVAPFLVSNSLTFGRYSSAGMRDSTVASGTFDLATVSGSRTQYRASLDYGVLPRLRLNTVSAEINRSFGDDTLVRASAGYILSGGQTQIGLSAAHRFRNLSLALDATTSLPDGVYAATLRLGFSFGRNPLSRRMFIARSGLSGSGAVAVRAFRDENRNQRFDESDAPLADVDFATAAISGRTDKQGITLIGGVGDGTRSSVRLDRNSLSDIAMAPVREGIEFVPRAGRIHISEFVIETLSDIEGTALFGTGGRAIAGVLLRLVTSEGLEVAHVRTASGGSFFFEQVHPGDYRLQLDAGQARRLNLRLGDMPLVHIGTDGTTHRMTVQVETSSPQS
ncbi:MAG: hypothetical protein B7Z37_21060 [Verrucomicrobia bacterium 12-59-8]|nr:MAG: hypothetical protein B7Z37_21060 [Verrucomicrobia bacterium 12-59-8]